MLMIHAVPSYATPCYAVLGYARPQWSKSGKVFQGGDCPRYCHFPSETNLVIVKYQKLAKSVGGNGVF